MGACCTQEGFLPVPSKMVFNPTMYTWFFATGANVWVLPWVFTVEAVQVLFKGLARVKFRGEGGSSEVTV